jgi:membrane protease YdiL (CAAX protease family)
MDLGKWETPEKINNLQLAIVGFLIVVLYFVQTTLPEDNAAPIFIGIAVMGIVLTVLLKIQPLGWGSSTKKLTDSFIFGAIFMIALGFLSGSLKLAIPVSLPFALFNIPSIIYVVIFAPFIEEFTFRERIIPFVARITNNFLIAMVISAIAFGAFHLAAYAPYAVSQGIGIDTLLFQAALFGFIASVGNALNGSSAFGLGMHITNNIIAFTRAIAG